MRRRLPEAGGTDLRGFAAALGALCAVLLLLPLHASGTEGGLALDAIMDAVFRPDDSLEQAMLLHLRLPRTAAALLAGGGLAVSGVLLQAVTRNPLASPGLLGVSAGAQFALVAGAVLLPGWSGRPLALAFGGALGAAALAYAVAGGLRASPLRLVLAGAATSLALGAAAAALALLAENEVGGLFLWGAGSVVQFDWQGPAEAVPRIAAGMVLAVLLARGLDLLALGDETAAALGVGVSWLRLLAAGAAVLLAAASVCLAGPIGFVGLLAPNALRLLGIRRHAVLTPLAALWGAALLLAADTVALAVSAGTAELPAGTVTALIGAPLLVALILRRADQGGRRGGAGSVLSAAGGQEAARPLAPVLAAGMLLVLAVLAAGVAAGSSGIDPAALLRAFGLGDAPGMAGLRLPRMLVAMVVGAMMAASGVLLQGVMRNPLAAPELIGVGPAAGLAALAALLLVPDASTGHLQAAALAGGLGAFGLLAAVGGRQGLPPLRLALVGLALGAACAALSALLVAHARLQLAQALVWLAGTTYGRGWGDLMPLLPWAALLLPAACTMARTLDLLALGDDHARVLGVRPGAGRLCATGLAVALTASAVAVVGPVGFVGLMAPHAARLLVGGGHRRLLPLAVLLGAALLGLADLAGRVLLAPAELPVGLATALVGTPYLLAMLWLAARRGRA